MKIVFLVFFFFDFSSFYLSFLFSLFFFFHFLLFTLFFSLFLIIISACTDIRTVVMRPGFVYGGNGGVLGGLYFDVKPDEKIVLWGGLEKRWRFFLIFFISFSLYSLSIIFKI